MDPDELYCFIWEGPSLSLVCEEEIFRCNRSRARDVESQIKRVGGCSVERRPVYIMAD